MEKYVKFLRKLSPQLRERLIRVIEKIAANDLKLLDIKRLSGSDLYRCRVGKICIIFEKKSEANFIIDIGFRENIY